MNSSFLVLNFFLYYEYHFVNYIELRQLNVVVNT